MFARGTVALAAVLGTSVADAGADAAAARVEFERFKAAYGRVYKGDGEEEQRLRHFTASLERIQAHNALPGITWWKGVNQFSDLSDEEFRRSVLMDPQNCSATHIATKPTRPAMVPDVPSHMDWRERGVVSEVKNQGHCGSCWTFSTTGCLEAHMAIKYQAWQAPRLSEQQLVDCAQDFDNHGCNGGLPSHAFEYIHSVGGLDTEFHYPYTAEDGKCKFDAAAAAARRGRGGPFEPSSAGIGAQVPGGSVNLTVGDEEGLRFHLATHGPVSVAFQVASDFRDYSHGVYTSTVCKNGPGDVNHAVLAVGYGTDPDTKMPYWLIKNSWDYSWGEEGFFKMEAFKNMCGVGDCMAFPDLYGLNDEPAPETLVV